MSFSRLNYDFCAYKHDLKQSKGSGEYILNTPIIDCQACFPSDPSLQFQGSGTSICDDKPLIDMDSELRSITRKASNCPTKKYLPQANENCSLKHFPDCRSIPNENTRLSNPPCTARCNGWNRWEWLCQNPQDKALIPFDFNISNRLVVKDNHRPCLPTPLNQANFLPVHNNSDSVVEYKQDIQQLENNIPSIHWRKSGSYAPYNVE